MKKIILLFSICLLLVGCGSKPEAVKDVDLNALATKITESVQFPALAEVNDEMASSIYYLNSDICESYKIIMPMMMVHATEVIMVKAKDGKFDEVKAAVEKRYTDLDNVWKQYLPDQYELVKNAKRVTKGNYYFLIIHENPEAIIKIIDEAFK